MSSNQPAPGQNPRVEADKERHYAQAGQWREIGITAVAAAARYAGEAHSPRVPKSGGEPNKIVTLRDIDHLAA
jgi:hypothetical protein